MTARAIFRPVIPILLLMAAVILALAAMISMTSSVISMTMPARRP